MSVTVVVHVSVLANFTVLADPKIFTVQAGCFVAVVVSSAVFTHTTAWLILVDTRFLIMPWSDLRTKFGKKRVV